MHYFALNNFGGNLATSIQNSTVELFSVLLGIQLVLLAPLIIGKRHALTHNNDDISISRSMKKKEIYF